MCVLLEPLFLTIPAIRVKQTTLWLAPLEEIIEGAPFFYKLLVKKKTAVRRSLVLLQEAAMWACLTQRNSLSSHNWTANIQNVSAEISVQQLVMCFPVEEMCEVFPLFWVCYWWRWRILLGMFCHNKLLWRFVRDNVHVGTCDLYCMQLTNKVGFTDKQYSGNM